MIVDKRLKNPKKPKKILGKSKETHYGTDEYIIIGCFNTSTPFQGNLVRIDEDGFLFNSKDRSYEIDTFHFCAKDYCIGKR